MTLQAVGLWRGCSSASLFFKLGAGQRKPGAGGKRQQLPWKKEAAEYQEMGALVHTRPTAWSWSFKCVDDGLALEEPVV